MSKLFSTLILLLIASMANAQDWINLEYPMSGILGRPVDKVTYNKSKQASNVNWKVGVPYDKNPTIDTDASAESVVEYEDKFRNFTTKYFNTDKHSLRSLKAHALKIRSLNEQSVKKLREGGKYIYEGITADSVTLWISFKKNQNYDITKVINDAASIAFNNPQSTELVKKILPVLDSISFKSKDSVYYKATVANPNVYYKVKMIKLTKLDKHDWESICLYFFDFNEATKDYPKVGTLTYDPMEVKSRTREYYPEFWGRGDRKDVLYSIGTRKIDDKLHLYLFESGAENDNKLVIKEEIPFSDVKGTRYWRMDRKLINKYEHNNRIKKVLVQVAAKQLDEDTVEITNWAGESSVARNAQTYMKYPEFKATYVYK